MSWRPSGWIDAHELHTRIGKGGWAPVLEQLGLPPEALKLRRQQPCPVCGGRDRYCYDDRFGRGDYICRHCGAGDALDLLMKLHRWTLPQAVERVCQVIGLSRARRENSPPPATPIVRIDRPAAPTPRVREILRGTCAPECVPDVVEYLNSRGLWPLPPECTLRAHASVEYWEGRERIGRYPALVAPVVDIDGELVTVHVTYLSRGRKLADHEPRKILSPLTDRTGCAVRLMPGGQSLGLSEGIESGLSASRLHAELLPVWAALNTSLLAKFDPPPSVQRLAIFADRDVPGLEAATHLMQRLQGRVEFAFEPPPAPAKDWNDVLMAGGSR